MKKNEKNFLYEYCTYKQTKQKITTPGTVNIQETPAYE